MLCAALCLLGSFLLLTFAMLTSGFEKSTDTYPRGKILVFGGNAFMGAATVRVLLEHHYSVAIANRGNWYWDANDWIKPYVRQIVCDRYADDVENSCPELVKYIEEVGHLHAVVDFSSLSGKAMENSLKLLHGKTDLYIYISSDSVYEISERDYDGASKEDGFKMIEDQTYLDILKQSDDYAWGKIEGELVLEKYAAKGLKYVALRLPDVIGPRDTFEERWFSYFLWLRFSRELNKAVLIPDMVLNAKISIVFVEDLAQMVGKIVEMDYGKLDKAYNLACSERTTLFHVLKTMEAEMGLAGINYGLDKKNEYYLWLPSVKRGPVDISKATKELDWQPSTVRVAVRETVRFFEEAMRRGASEPAYRKQREKVVQKLKDVVFKGQEADLDEAIDSTYRPYQSLKKKGEL